jgi:predicted outer membrane repeat protein
MKKITILVLTIFAAHLMFAQITNIPDDYPTIQQGIDAANEGDTVLVHPGIYVENIHLTKNLIIGSLLLTTQDTSYLSQTIIDGNQAEPVIRIFGLWENSIDSTCIVAGFTIRNGHGNWDTDAGGIVCYGASPILKNLIISNNHAGEFGRGGGIGCQFGGYYQNIPSNPLIQDVIISGNSAESFWGGGGLFCGAGNPTLINVVFTNNSSYNGGILYIRSWEYGSLITMDHVIITNNSGNGLVLDGYEGLNATLNDVIIKDNTGCGIRSVLSTLYLSGVSIANNMGGLNSMFDEVLFDSINRCSIYNNYVGYEVKDISGSTSMEVVLDTFTVLTPTSFHVNQLSNCSFDIWHGVLDQIDADVFISPEGDDNNSGINPDEPLKTIFTAQLRLLENYTIFLADGTYSSSLTGELFPIQLNNLNLAGGSSDNVILDGSGSTVLEIFNNNLNMVSGLTITGGEHGIWMKGSNTIIENVNITNNSSQNEGGGMFLWLSNPTLKNVLVGGNTAPNGGGIYMQESGPMIQNVTISNNTATDKGGGIYMSQSSSTLKDVIIDGNSANKGGAIHSDNSNPIIQNSTFADNTGVSYYTGGIHCTGGSNISLTNSILWENNPEQIFIQGVYAQNNVEISYSDIQDGEEGIIISGTGTFEWLEGNIDEDPMFVMSGDHPYQVNDYSPCIDAGTPDTTGLNLPELDLAGNPRFVNNRIDMGAYEWNMFVGVEEPVINEKARVSIYPNPLNDHLYIDFELESESSITLDICNVSGKRMKAISGQSVAAGAQHFELKMQDLPTGIYFLRLKAGNEVVTKKVVKL